jgi:hypothetical protein
VFCQGEALVAIRGKSLMVCKPGTIQDLIDEVADIEKWNDRTRSFVRCPLTKDACINVLDGSRIDGLLPLKGLAHLPYLGPKGELVTEPGYNADSGYYLLDSEDLRKVELPTELSQRSALAAMQFLYDVTYDIHFAEGAHDYAWVALLLTMLARPTIDGATPMFAFDASSPGSGKTLLVRSAALVAYGDEYLCSASIANHTEELRKAITTYVAAGKPVMLLDNFAGTLKNSDLEAAITSGKWEDRQLGNNVSISASMQMIFALTGNNLKMSDDMARRSVVCRLEPRVSILKRREFKHGEMDDHVKKHRFALYTAALTILAAHAAEGSPDAGVKEQPSFKPWTRKVASAIAWAGGKDVTSLFAAQGGNDGASTDDEINRCVAVVHLERMFPKGTWFKAHDLYDRLWGEHNQRGQWPDLVDALDGLRTGDTTKPPSVKVIGSTLGAMRSRPLGESGLRLEESRHKSDKVKIWQVVEAAGNEQEPLAAEE